MIAVATPDRSTFLGGSDAPSVLGIGRRTPVELWREKTGREVFQPDPVLEKILRRGQKLEPFIREMTVEKLRDLGHDVELLAVNERYRDPAHPFLSCEIDFELLLDGEHVNADAKSVGGQARAKWGTEGTDEIPLDYAAQFMDGLMITGRQRCLAAALRSFDDVDLYWIERDEETITAMREKLVSFWVDHVQRDVPPDPVKFSDVRDLFPASNGKRIEASSEILEHVAELQQIAKRIQALKDREEFLRFYVAKFMGPHSVLTQGPRDVLSWEVEARSKFELEAFRRQHPDLAALFTTTQRTRVLRVAKSRAARSR